MVRMGVAREDPERHIFIGLLFNMPRTADSDAVPIEEEFEHHEGMVRRVCAFRVKALIHDFGEIQSVHHIADEAPGVLPATTCADHAAKLMAFQARKEGNDSHPREPPAVRL